MTTISVEYTIKYQLDFRSSTTSFKIKFETFLIQLRIIIYNQLNQTSWAGQV